MHQSVLDFTAYCLREGTDLNRGNILEIGAQDVNGSVRPMFDRVDSWLGTDMQPGPGVDLVCEASKLHLSEELPFHEFDGIVCTEMLEHDATFWLTLEVIRLLLKPAGWLLLTARGATPGGRSMVEHSYPHDYFRFMPQSVPWLLELAGCVPATIRQDPEMPGFHALGWRTTT